MTIHRLHFDSLPSTHLHALESGEGLSDRSVITAGWQSEGRGRFGRSWISPAGQSLLLSIVLKPAVAPEQAAQILGVLSLSAVRALDRMGVETRIRWPNDIVVEEKKIAGLLAEASLAGKSVAFVVASVGLNLHQRREALAAIDRPATSVFAETGIKRSVDEALTLLWEAFEPLYDQFLAEGFSSIADAWRTRMSLLGEEVTVDAGGGMIDGRVESFGDDGSMEVRDRGGKTHRLIAGEIRRVNSASARRP